MDLVFVPLIGINYGKLVGLLAVGWLSKPPPEWVVVVP